MFGLPNRASFSGDAGTFITGNPYPESVYPTDAQFSPDRQISAPAMFGSLLTGADHPWRTPLFRPANLPGLRATKWRLLGVNRFGQ